MPGPNSTRVVDALARGLGTAVGWGLFALGCLLWALIVVPVTLLLATVWPAARERFADFTHVALRFYVRTVPFMRVVVEGRERCGSRPHVLVANHQSFLDPIVMMALERRLSGPARRYLFETPMLGRVLRHMSFYEGEVGEPAALERMQSAERAARARGGALLFFPEGTRSRNGDVGPFHRGAFRLAVDQGIPIQPVVIEGLDRVLPRHSPVVRKGWRYPVRVRYLPPVEPPFGEGPRRSVVRALADSVRSTMAEEIERMRKERASREREPA